MQITNTQIQDAVNAAETEASTRLSDRHPITIENGTLLKLIEGSKQWLQFSATDVGAESETRG